MEAVKPKKSKKPQTSVRDQASVTTKIDMKLPDVPQNEPCRVVTHDFDAPQGEPCRVVAPVSDTQEECCRAVTPEPEEIIFSSNEQASTFAPQSTSVPSIDCLPSSDSAPEHEKCIAKVDNLSWPEEQSKDMCYPSVHPLDVHTTCVSSSSTTNNTDFCASHVAEAPPLYPSLTGLHYERNKHGLLTEANLHVFYNNPLYTIRDEYVGRFVQYNLAPSGPIFALLNRLKRIGDEMSITEVCEKDNTSALNKALRDCWIIQQHTIETKNKCGENKEAIGVGEFSKSVLCAENLGKLKNLLVANRNHILNERFCQEVQFQSTALQIQWLIICINKRFMEENGLSMMSQPLLIESAVVTVGRASLLNALSDIFFYLRFPALPKRVSDVLISWVKELVSVLYLSCRCEDAQFVLCHLLRLPSPISDWAPPLVQTFIQASSPAKVKIDYCIAMLAHLLSPITERELFLRQISISEKDDSTWAILSNDDEEGDFSFVTFKECDLTSLFDQLPISELYSLAHLHFSNLASSKEDQFLSLISFQLLLMKVFDAGLSTYCKPMYKLLCKQIGNSLRQSVRELCNFWKIWRNSFRLGEDNQLQKELDHVMILAIQYIVNRPGLGLWQFLYDLPFDSVTEECRSRCEYFLREINTITVADLYDIPQSELLIKNRTTSLKEKVETLGLMDSVFLVSTLAAIMSYSHSDSVYLVKEIVDVCFCEESSRENLCKVGSEAIALLLLRRPSTFDQLLIVLDRNMSHMGNYAADVLASSNLSECKLSQTSMSILGKWLINKPPDDPANRMARRIMSSVYWGMNETGDQLWIDPTVHEISADTLVKAHSIHCSCSNGMIAKSIRQVSKLASRMADHENLFNQFCWDVLIKVKFSLKKTSGPPQSNLLAFFVHIAHNCLESVDSFLDRGVPLINELVTACCSTASVVLLARFIEKNYSNVSTIGSHKGFMELLERILHMDQCSYAMQWITGPSSMPTPIIRLICSSLAYYSKQVHDVGKYLCAWVDILCVRRQATWNNDGATLQILNSVVLIAFTIDANCLLGIPDVIHNLYQQMLKSWRENTRGIFSMFTAVQIPPPLIASSLYEIAPWATYLLLSVESKSYPTFYQYLYETFAKGDKITVDEACKRAGTKSSILLNTTRLAVYRWAEFVCVSSESSVFPLAMQALVMESYSLRIVNGRKYCFARRFLDSSSAQSILVPCRKILTEVVDPKGLAKAVSGWLFCSHEVTQTGFDFSVFDLDYLLQLVLGGEMGVWINFVDNHRLLQEKSKDEELFSITCHLGVKKRSTHNVLDQLSKKPYNSQTVGFPPLPTHPGLPISPLIETNTLHNMTAIVDLLSPVIKRIHLLSEDYVVGGENIAQEDAKYADLVSRLHTTIVQQVPVQLRCGFRCSLPRQVVVQVSGTKFDEVVDASMTKTREDRNAILGKLYSHVLDEMVVKSATMEHIARQLIYMRNICTSEHRQNIQISGRSIFKMVASSLSAVEMLFPAATAAYQHTLCMLADGFVRMQPEEQIPLISIILDGFALSDSLVEAFTPECLSSTELCTAYICLSDALRDTERSSRAFKLLKRLAIDKAAVSLPPQQFAPLIPLAFQNLANQRQSDAPLHILCLDHVITFVFHAFPSNFGAGLDIALDGCNTGETPVALLEVFADRLGADNFENPKTEYVIHSEKATEYAMQLARKLKEARSRLSSIYTVWRQYLDCITKLAQLFLFITAKEAFLSDSPSVVMQKELAIVFHQVLDVFSPLIAPISPSLPPFCPANDAEAHMAMDRLVQLLTVLPYNTALQPGTQNLPSLVWQFYFEKLSILSHGSSHYYSVIETHLVRIPWNSFYPSQRGLSAMLQCLATRSQYCAPFVGQIIVRVHWMDLLTNHIQNEIIPHYLSILFNVLVRIGSNESNYVKIRASFLDLVKYLSQRSDWSAISPEHTEDLAEVVTVCFPRDSLTNPTDVVAVLQRIWRKICCFIVREQCTSMASFKQTMWVKVECSLLLREDASNALPAYSTLIMDVDSLAQQHEDIRAFSTVAQELTTFWGTVSDSKFKESIVTTWNKYLDTNYESPLVLMSLSTVIGSLNEDSIVIALKVLEKTIRSYFKRNFFSWEELTCWIQCPSSRLIKVHEYLFNSSSCNRSYPLMLTMAWFLRLNQQYDAVLSLHRFIINIKPKNVWCEASFLLLIWQEVRWLVDSVLAAYVNPNETLDDRLPTFMHWLNKASKDDSSFITSLLSGRKSAFSHRIRIIFTILELYLTQQMVGGTQLPRAREGAPVLNSRINALKETAAAKANQQYAAAFNVATPFFVQVDIHHIGSTPTLVLHCSRALFNERFLCHL